MTINAISQKWNSMTKAQKVATVAGTVVGTAAVASAVAAGVMGKDSFRKVAEGAAEGAKAKLDILGGFKAGYQKLGQTIANSKVAEVAKNAVVGVKNLFSTKGPDATK